MSATTEPQGGVALLPRSFTPAERRQLREHLRHELPRLKGLLDAAQDAADGPDPETALVFVGMLASRSLFLLFPL